MQIFQIQRGCAYFGTDLKLLAHKIWMLKGCFPLGGIFRAQRNFSLFVSSQAELIEKRQLKKIVLRAENSA